MNIEPAKPSDLHELMQLLAEMKLPNDDLVPELLSYFWLLREDDRLVGCIGLQPLGETGLLRSLAVVPVKRGAGLGGSLVSRVEIEAARLGIETLFLLTTTARDFFAARGYVQVERIVAPSSLQRTAEFQTLCPETAVCMRKVL